MTKRKLYCVIELDEVASDYAAEDYALDLVTCLRQAAPGNLWFMTKLDVYLDLPELLNEHLLPTALE